VPYREEQNVCDHTEIFRWYYEPFSSFENLTRYICHHVSAVPCGWVNGSYGDTINWISSLAEERILNPYSILHKFSTGKPNLATDDGVKYRVLLDVSYLLVGVYVLKLGLRKFLSKSTGRKSCNLHRYLLVSIVLFSCPLLFRLVFQISDLAIQAGNTFSVCFDRPLGAYIASSLKGGLMVSAFFLLSFAGLAGKLYISNCVYWNCLVELTLTIIWQLFYCAVCVLVLAQSAYLLLLCTFHSFLITAHTLLSPLFIACSAEKSFAKYTSGYLRFLCELIACMVAWVVLSLCQRALLQSEIFIPWKIAGEAASLQLMILVPRIISLFALSPCSEYLSMNPVCGLGLGVADLIKSLTDTFDELRENSNQRRISTPR